MQTSESKPVQLHVAVNRSLLGRVKTPLPADIDAAQFHRFFDDKVDGVGHRIPSTTYDAPPPSFSPNHSAVSFSQFVVDDVVSAIRALPDKTCALHPHCRHTS